MALLIVREKMLNPPAPTTPHLAIKLTNAETDSYGVIKIKIKKKTSEIDDVRHPH